jgi:hypothetical protein
MKVQYLFSSAEGDRPATEEELDGPLHTSLSVTHPVLTLRNYFDSIEQLLLKDDEATLKQAVFRGFGRHVTPGMISRVEIRCEKVGTLYHVASITLHSGGEPMRLAVATAVTDEAVRCMKKEVLHLALLTDTYLLTSLPKVYSTGDVACHTPRGDFTLSHVIQEWFEDYHEWHLSRGEGGEVQRLLIWDQKRGYRSASPMEYHEIFRQAAGILTLCYDTRTFRQVYPWHHAAGDFIVKSSGQGVDVKLTTVRGYDPILVFREKEEWDPWKALVIFFLNLTVKMRLDREDGVGDVMWADDPCVSATVQGFTDALRVMEKQGRLHLGKAGGASQAGALGTSGRAEPAEAPPLSRQGFGGSPHSSTDGRRPRLPAKAGDVIALLKAFTVEELRRLAGILLPFYRQNERGSYPVVRSNMETHVSRLHQVIQALP